MCVCGLSLTFVFYFIQSPHPLFGFKGRLLTISSPPGCLEEHYFKK